MPNKPKPSFSMSQAQETRADAFAQRLQEEFGDNKTSVILPGRYHTTFKTPISMTELRKHRGFVMKTLWEAFGGVQAKWDQCIWVLERHGVPVAKLASVFAAHDEESHQRARINSTQFGKHLGSIIEKARQGTGYLLTNRNYPIGHIHSIQTSLPFGQNTTQTPPSERAATGESQK